MTTGPRKQEFEFNYENIIMIEEKNMQKKKNHFKNTRKSL